MDLNTAQLMAIEYAIAIMGLYLGYKCIYLKKDNMNLFMRFVGALNIFLLVNIPIRYVELHLVVWNRLFVFILYAISVVLMTFTMFYWFLFSLKQINSKIVDTKRKLHLSLIPALLTIPLCIINYWTGWLYIIDESSWYKRGSIFILQSLISYGYFLLIIICNIICLIKGEEVKAAKKCFAATVPAMVCAGMQILYGGSYLLLGAVFGAWMMYIEICLDRQKAYEMSDAVQAVNEKLIHSNKEIRQNMSTILVLSDIYNIMYEVDLQNDTLSEIKSTDTFSAFCSKYTSAKECLMGIPDAMFSEAYVDIMKELYDLSTIRKRLKSANNCFADGIGKLSEEWLRTTFAVTERDNNGNPIRLVFSIQEVGQLIEQQKKIEEAQMFEEHAKDMKELFIQTAEALASAIDAKDKYTHGHSVRVAKYSRKIASLSGMPESECEKVYFAGLLHDVGKIGVPDSIIKKEGKLTKEEYDAIKLHPVFGKQILERINRLPYLSIGADCHHERYDGKGYPSGLKGTDIPEIARIIAVADAYDAMTSRRSYRNTIPQQAVREELVKGMGTQFDPKFAKIMVHLIDLDLEYKMKEKEIIDNDSNGNELQCKDYRANYSQGIILNEYKTRLKFTYEGYTKSKEAMPSFVFFDSLDGSVHSDDDFKDLLLYYEYGEIKADGTYDFDGTRKTQINIDKSAEGSDVKDSECQIEAIKESDHIYFEMQSRGQKVTATVALPDSTRYAYVSITGENCHIQNIEVNRDSQKTKDGTIKRIVEKISFLSGAEGNIPSIQIDGWRSAATKGIRIDRDKDITFKMKSLPFARLVWHCPFVVLFHSANGMVNGEDYREYGVIRLDGESWAEPEYARNVTTVNKTEDFISWEDWKQGNKDGRSCNVSIRLSGKQVMLKTSNGGIDIENLTIIEDSAGVIYAALTGDQCVIENINVHDAVSK